MIQTDLNNPNSKAGRADYIKIFETKNLTQTLIVLMQEKLEKKVDFDSCMFEVKCEVFGARCLV